LLFTHSGDILKPLHEVHVGYEILHRGTVQMIQFNFSIMLRIFDYFVHCAAITHMHGSALRCVLFITYLCLNFSVFPKESVSVIRKLYS